MTRPHIEPQPDNTFRIVHAPGYGASSAILRRIETGEIAPADAEAQLKNILQKYPWQFEAAWALSGLYTAAGKFREACEVRFEASQRLIELLPEDEDAEPVALDFERKENRAALFLLHGSAVDHFLAGEFEMAAALLETLLELDEEDHLDASPMLAWCYVALDEPDSLDAVLPDLDDKSAEKALVRLWAALRFDGKIDPASLAGFRKQFPEVYAEFTAAAHPADEAYLAEIDSERPSPASRARLLWFRTEHLWEKFPGFPEALKK